MSPSAWTASAEVGDETRIMFTVPRNAVPSTRRSAVLNGTITTSSWSCPQVVCPFGASTPTTRKGTARTRMAAPSGSSPGTKSLSTSVCPRTATLAALSSSDWVKKRPPATGQSRTAE